MSQIEGNIRHFLKLCFDSSTVIFSTKLNVKCKTKCSLDKTNNRTEH